ncbi:MAG: quinone oxidoreductase family protein [Acidobacteriaceae bacterium]
MSPLLVQQARIHSYGDSSVLQIDNVELPPPASGEVRVRNIAIGVNFVDIYHRTGLYQLPNLPAALGVEGAGVIEAVGPGVNNLMAGQRVAYAGLPPGSYSTARNLPAERALVLPDSIPFDLAAAVMIRGMTAHMLLGTIHPIRTGDTVLVHAAAGGLGLVLVQWAKALGARVIGTVSNQDKADLALAHGLDRAVLYRKEDFVTAVKDFTEGESVHFAIDGIGGDTLLRTLEVIRPFGMVASIEQVSGHISPIDPALLGPFRSLSLSRPSVFRFTSENELSRS